VPIEPLYNETAILRQIATGSEAAFTALFSHYRGRVEAIAFTLTHSETLAEELLQDIFLRIWLKRADLATINDFQSYLFITTRNQAYSTLKREAARRKANQNAAATIDLSDPATDHKLLQNDFGRLLEQAITRLPPQQRQAYRLSREQGLSRDEIAATLGLSPNTVKSHISQALKNIRAFCIARLDPLSIIILTAWLAHESGIN
jgi:RNA polymerase sigma-70 factor (family 1)